MFTIQSTVMAGPTIRKWKSSLWLMSKWMGTDTVHDARVQRHVMHKNENFVVLLAIHAIHHIPSVGLGTN